MKEEEGGRGEHFLVGQCFPVGKHLPVGNCLPVPEAFTSWEVFPTWEACLDGKCFPNLQHRMETKKIVKFFPEP